MAEGKKKMDVSKPGDSAPDTTARPVIVPRGPMIKDPMMKNTDNPAVMPEVEPPKTTPSKVRGDKVIQPLSQTEPDKQAVPTENTPESKSDPEVEPDAEPTEVTEPQTTEKEPAPAEKNPDAEQAAIVDAVVDQADISSKKKDSAAAEQEKAKQEALAKLVADKTYFVPISHAKQKRHNLTMVIVLVLIVSAAAVYLLADAGIIKTTITLPVDLIKN